MTNTDVVFEKFAEANPVDSEAVPASLPSADDILESLQAPRRSRRAERGPGRSRSGWVVALASFVVVVSLGVGLNWLRGETDSLDSLDAIQRDGVSAAERWLEAVNRGDIETVMALSSPGSSQIADRRVAEWLAGFSAQGMPTRVDGCRAVATTLDGVSVECQVHLTDPVAVEVGVSDLIAPFVYEDGLVTWQPYRGGDISQVNTSYSRYLQAFHRAEYDAVCSPDAYESGSVVHDRQLALTGECAELAAPLANDVAQWIRDGRSASDS